MHSLSSVEEGHIELGDDYVTGAGVVEAEVGGLESGPVDTGSVVVHVMVGDLVDGRKVVAILEKNKLFIDLVI